MGDGAGIQIFFFFFLMFFSYFVFFFLVFCIGVQSINNVVLVSDVQQSDSVIHIQVSIFFQILFPFRLLQSTEQSSLCSTVGRSLLVIYFKYSSVYMSISNSRSMGCKSRFVFSPVHVTVPHCSQSCEMWFF